MVIRFVLGWYRMQLSVNGAKFLPSFRLNIDKGSSWIRRSILSHFELYAEENTGNWLVLDYKFYLQCTPLETTWLHVMRMFFIF